MNTVIATNTIPVTQNVMLIVSSIAPQLEAIGVKYHGLRKWNATEPKTSKSKTIAMAIVVSRCVDRPPSRARHVLANDGHR
jgi:hypothetical protein